MKAGTGSGTDGWVGGQLPAILHQLPVFVLQNVLMGPTDPAVAEGSAPMGWGGTAPAAAR